VRARIRGKAKPKPRIRIRMRIDGKLCTPEQALLVTQLRGRGYAALPEVRFHPERKWRIDVAITRQAPVVVDAQSQAMAIEINGGAFSRGRHVRGDGFVKDMEKLNALTELGWRILQFTPQQVLDGTALAQIVRCL
jgi:hypothetical protein